MLLHHDSSRKPLLSLQGQQCGEAVSALVTRLSCHVNEVGGSLSFRLHFPVLFHLRSNVAGYIDGTQIYFTLVN